MKKNLPVVLLAIIGIICLLIIGPIKQDLEYHKFADERSFLNIPNFLNVVSNLPFLFVGIFGLWKIRKIENRNTMLIGIFIFSWFILLTFGSGYYHLFPNNTNLIFDRIPIVVVLMSFLTYFIDNKLTTGKEFYMLFLLNLMGIATVIYWGVTEAKGYGDLRWYGFTQFFPIIAIPLLLWTHKTPKKALEKDRSDLFVFWTCQTRRKV